MKALLVVFVLVCAVVGAVLYFGLGGFDPMAEAQDVRASIEPGMDWTQVVEIKRPRKMVVYEPNPESDNYMAETPPRDFDEATVREAIAEGWYGEGFKFEYNMGNNEAFAVQFDQHGVVTEITELMTFGDLL